MFHRESHTSIIEHTSIIIAVIEQTRAVNITKLLNSKAQTFPYHQSANDYELEPSIVSLCCDFLHTKHPVDKIIFHLQRTLLYRIAFVKRLRRGCYTFPNASATISQNVIGNRWRPQLMQTFACQNDQL